MFVDQLLRLFDAVRAGKETPRFSFRLGAATWGSAVLHGAILVRSQGGVPVWGDYLEPLAVLFILIPIYSITFGLVVAVGMPRGSLIRHFVYGVFLPTVAYSLAAATLGD